ncbi:hypothetical protein UZ38_37000 [Bacillus amyloliquefaciens]|jgi:hypothetical protein|nr:hypothetical protein BaLi_c06090 [Bacillus paralicheniformis ATCC 9945a]KJD52577.1 hypothetical protein UZ38_37000 [Bacillus amyloliquefaciens]KUL09086.1 hypothetical protein LI7559_13580 [Bacillus licheniformis LMG 7559]KUL15710.1 hypothetical protein LI6934_19160 [Bacillus licheniformis LMG 6934]VEB17662.1 Uncharacterised protein [Bacillus paralicheniformis]GIN78573.1 hypothetical protein J41TS8_36140 [Bacillus sp. J41TS8]
MGNFSTKLLKAWLAIPRWFRVFTLSAITIYILWSFFINGIKKIFKLDTSTLVISLIASGIILIIFNKSSVKK